MSHDYLEVNSKSSAEAPKRMIPTCQPPGRLPAQASRLVGPREVCSISSAQRDAPSPGRARRYGARNHGDHRPSVA